MRYRAKLVQLRTGLKAQVHAVMAKEGVLPKVTDIFGPAGTRQLDALELGTPFAHRVSSLRELIAAFDGEISRLERDIHLHLKGDRGYRAVQAINGIGKVSAAVLSRDRRRTRPRTCVRGSGSRPAIASPISKRVAAGSPSKGRG